MPRVPRAKKTIQTGKGPLPVLESRSAIRHRTAVRAEVRALESRSWVPVRLVNLSRTGARFQGDLITVPGTVIIMRVRLDELNKVHELYGTIAWRKKDHFGVQFI